MKFRISLPFFTRVRLKPVGGRVLVTESGQTVSEEAFAASLVFLKKARAKFDPLDDASLNPVVDDIEAFLQRQRIFVPPDGPEAIVGWMITGETSFE